MIDLAQGVAEALEKEATLTPEEAGAYWSQGGPTVASEDLTYPGGAGQPQRLRLYRGGAEGAPVLLYIHGGGWVGGSIELHDYSARGLAAGAGVDVVSISYRFAPAHPFPAGLEDCLAAARWIETEGAALGLTGPLVIGGASAGGNLAAAAALRSDPGRFAGLLIFYGVLGCDFDSDSYTRYRDGPGLTRARMMELFGHYDPERRAASEPLITPVLSGDLSRLPDTAIIAAEHDVLLDDNRAFAEALRAAGVPTDYHVEPGVTHGFINRGRLVPATDAAIARACAFLASVGTKETTA